MPPSPSFDTYVGFLKQAAELKYAGFWSSIGKGLTSDLASRVYGGAAGAGAGYGLSNWSADHLGLTPNEKQYTVPVATALSAFMGNRAGSATRLAGAAAGGGRMAAVGAGLKEIEQSIPKILGVDVAAGAGVMGAIRGGEYLKNQNQIAQHQIANPSTSAPGGAPGVTVNPTITNNIPSPAATAAGEAPVGLWDKTVQFATDHPGAVIGGALAFPAMAALYQISRAAGVIGDQKSIRMSASLRKRRGQATDLNLGLAPYSAPKDIANTKPMAGRLAPAGGSDDDSYLDEE